jgi:catechol 2,3-dioxygenase-like lactoylglutathione lyase family enzyme
MAADERTPPAVPGSGWLRVACEARVHETGSRGKVGGMTTKLGAFVLGTPDPPALADFYRALLGWEEVVRSPEWVRLRAPEQERPSLSFQLEKDHVPPTWPQRPGTQQMQAHLDVQVDDLEAETARACALGATVQEHQPAKDVRVLRDPHGHPFCLFLPGA